MDINSLDRFLDAQERVYDIAFMEIRRGKKRSHWMWFIFPQLRGLGRSQMSIIYGIADLDEAKKYLSHPILGSRLIEITRALLSVNGKTAKEICGEIDSQKLRSSMTLFAVASEENTIFADAINKYFNGEPDSQTLQILNIK